MFKVPEKYRDQDDPNLSTTARDGNNGLFYLDSPRPGWKLAVIASDGEGWEHISLQAFRYKGIGALIQSRTPQWDEMCYAKDQFWDAEDLCIQVHPRHSEYVNCHPNVLHIWRPIGIEIPTPDQYLIGPSSSQFSQRLSTIHDGVESGVIKPNPDVEHLK
jgi:hypothetical protein